MDGSRGTRRAVEEVFGACAIIERCQWHKRENLVDYLPKGRKAHFRTLLQNAYEQPTYEAAKGALMRAKKELSLVNESAVRSLEEGMEQTLTLHRLGLLRSWGQILKPAIPSSPS
jgi:putative transposase